MLWQLCNDASDTALTENNEFAPEYGCNLFSLTLSVIGPLSSWLKDPVSPSGVDVNYSV